MAFKPYHILSSFIFFVFLVFSATGHTKRNIPSNKKPSAFDFINQLQGYQKGRKSENIHQLKYYLQRFGYLDHNNNHSHDDSFDDDLESAIKAYQRNFHTKPTGKLDALTVSTMTTPRCAVPDIVNDANHMMQPQHTFYGGNRWSKGRLTYRFMLPFPRAAMAPVQRAFEKWASATEDLITFSEVETDAESDITIGYYSGNHGDNAPFDGPGGVIAHAYPPTDGRFHYDSDERWTIGAIAKFFDLETVALHEIGHLLGLGHNNQIKESIMYPSLDTGITKDLHPDDIDGIKILYKNGNP